MPRLYASLPGRFFFPVLYLLIAGPALASETVVESVSEATRVSGTVKSWAGKSDTEMKSARDKLGRLSGYQIESEWNLFRRIGKSWGALVGVDGKRDYQEDLDYGRAPSPKKGQRTGTKSAPRVAARNYVDYYYGGARWTALVAGAAVTADLLYNRVGEADDQLANGYDGFGMADVRTRRHVLDWLRVKARARYIEYFRTRSGPGLDARQIRVELTPAWEKDDWSAGFQNRLTHRLRTTGSRYYADAAPFVSYRREFLEVTLKTVFTPLVSADGQLFADSWAERPTYSLDLTFSL